MLVVANAIEKIRKLVGMLSERGSPESQGNMAVSSRPVGTCHWRDLSTSGMAVSCNALWARGTASC